MLQLVPADPANVLYLVLVDVQARVGLDKKNVIDLVFAPFPITGCQVMDPRQVFKVRDRDVCIWYSQLVIQFSDSSPLGTLDIAHQVPMACFGRMGKRMRTTGVGPHVRKCDLLACPLLKEQLLGGRMEEEGGECAVKEALVDVGHQVAVFFRGGTDGVVIFVQYDADFVHKTDLLFVIAGQVIVYRAIASRAIGRCRVGWEVGADKSGLYFWKQCTNVVGGDGSRIGDSSGCRHLDGFNSGLVRRDLQLERAYYREVERLCR